MRLTLRGKSFAQMLAVLLVASTLAVVPFIADAGAQDNPRWVCDGTPILMRGGVFHFILPDPAVPGNLIIEAIPGTSGIVNSTAYVPTTNWVYGVANVGGTRNVRAYDANGDVVFNTPIQAPYPHAANQFAA